MGDFFNDRADLSTEQKRAILATLLRKKADQSKYFPLSFSQQHLWHLEQLTPGNPAYNVPVAFQLKGPLNVAALERVLNEIVRRHEALRTTYDVVDGEPVQIVQAHFPVPLLLIDLTHLTKDEQQAEAKRLVSDEDHKSFDLFHGPILRSSLLQLGGEDYVFLVNMHRMVAESWSLGVLFAELKVLYAAFASGQPSPLHELPIQYKDFVLWQRQRLQGEVLSEQQAYWSQRLAGIPPDFQLPTDRPRPAVPTFHGAHQPVLLSQDLIERLKLLSRQEGVTLYVMMLTGLKALLYQWTGQEDIVVGAPVAANRDRRETEGLIGIFGNFLVLHTRLSGNPTFREMLCQERDVVLEAYAHQDLPFGDVLKALQQEPDLRYQRLIRVMFALHTPHVPNLELAGLKVDLFGVEKSLAVFDLTLGFFEWLGQMFGHFEYRTELFDTSTVENLAESYGAILERCVQDPEVRLADLPLSKRLELKSGAALAPPPIRLDDEVKHLT